MSLEIEISTALSPLVAGRVHAVVFPQEQKTPITPAIVYTFISDTPTPDICGDGGPSTSDQRTQVDVYSTTFDGVRALRLQIIEAMTSITTPTLWSGDNGADPYSADLKLHRCSMDFTSYPSS